MPVCIYYASKSIVAQGDKGDDWWYEYSPVIGGYFLNHKQEVFGIAFRSDFEITRTKEVLAHTATIPEDVNTPKGLKSRRVPFEGKLRLVFLQMPEFTLTESECTNDLFKWAYIMNNMEKDIPWAAQDGSNMEMRHVSMKVVSLAILVLMTALNGCHRETGIVQPQRPGDDEVSAPVKEQLEAHNLLANPGFENGLESWTWLDWSKGWGAFALGTDRAYEGTKSLHLPVVSADKRPTVVWGGVQEIELKGEIPECIEGYYYVDNWTTGNWKQYLQLVVIDLTHSLGPNRGQAQLRYIVSGSKEPPLQIANASYLFAEKERRDTPVIGQWTYFSVNPKADYIQSWHYTPQAGSKLRVLFEARFDLHHDLTKPARADVYYDNLYFGPKTATHCAQ